MQLTFSNLRLEESEKPDSYQIVPQMNFEGEWGKLEAENCFQRESWTKYMKQTLVLIRKNALRESFDFFSANIKKYFE